MKRYVVGIDVGGSFIKAGILLDGNILSSLKAPTPKSNISNTLLNIINNLSADISVKMEEIVGVGVDFPGVVDAKNGVVLSCSNLPYKNLPLVKELEAVSGLPVKLCNDGYAAALGEHYYGAAKGFEKSLTVMIGTGVGGAYLENGTIINGELGHFTLVFGGKECGCGLFGCAESYCTATALIKTAKNYGLSVLDGHEFFLLVASGDETAKNALADYLRYLAATLISLYNVYNPEIIVVGGGITGSGELLFAPLREEIARQTANFCYKDNLAKIVPSSLGADVGIYGSAAMVVDGL